MKLFNRPPRISLSRGNSVPFSSSCRSRSGSAKKAGILLTALCLTGSLLTACAAPSSDSDDSGDRGSTSFFAMDTFMDITAYGPQGQAAADALKDRICRLEAEISRTDADSPIFRLNHSDGAKIDAEPDILRLLEDSAQFYEETQGNFDITITSIEDLWGFSSDTFRVPSADEIAQSMETVGMDHVHWDQNNVWLDSGTKIDFGGIAKGYADDQALELFDRFAVKNGIANLGGDLLIRGTRPDGSPWRIGLQDPLDGDNQSQFIGILEAEDLFVLTSGNYQRYFEVDGTTYHHIIDPGTGQPSQSGLSSVTICSPLGHYSGAHCDALATALFILGPERALEFWRGSSEYFDMVLVTEDNRVLITAGLTDLFHPNEDSPYTFSLIA